MKKAKKLLKWLGLVGLAGGAVAAGVIYTNQPLRVKVLTVAPKTVETAVTEEGIVSPVSDKTVYPLTAGTVETAYVSEGMRWGKTILFLR
jgi:multidrug efflux pump subunit AcrA (membrane-fusion protein)